MLHIFIECVWSFKHSPVVIVCGLRIIGDIFGAVRRYQHEVLSSAVFKSTEYVLLFVHREDLEAVTYSAYIDAGLHSEYRILGSVRN